jgi:hypothetical protein
VLVVVLIIVYMRTLELGTLDQSPRSWTAKPNSDGGKNVIPSINGLIYRRGQRSQSAVDMETRWTNSQLIS